MPENQFGMLIDPEGKAVESLSAEEHKNLRTCLDILREKRGMNLLASMLWHFNDGKTDTPDLLNGLVGEYLTWCNMTKLGFEPHPWITGFIATESKKMLALRENELPTILATVAAVRAGGWFADWMSTQVRAIADGTTPAERHPTPREVVASLAGGLQEFEGKMRTVNDFVKERPDFFLDQQLDTLITAAVGEKDAPQIIAKARQGREKVKEALRKPKSEKGAKDAAQAK